jgi:phospholipid/cholesterol/gamma-HCH transport system substrate-binding protein
MTRTRMIEALVGAFMAAGFVALFFLAMQVSNLRSGGAGDGYRLTALFDNVGSLKVRAPVTMAGVRIGRVESITFDRDSFQALVSFRIDEEMDTIPEDTIASILTAGLLGEQYVGLEPGGSGQFLREGDRIGVTQSAFLLEQMIGHLLFSNAQETSE